MCDFFRLRVRSAHRSEPRGVALRGQFVDAGGELRVLLAQADELGPRVVALVEPVGVHEPRRVVGGVVSERLQERGLVAHGRLRLGSAAAVCDTSGSLGGFVMSTTPPTNPATPDTAAYPEPTEADHYAMFASVVWFRE